MQGGQAFAVAGGQGFGVAYLLYGATHNNPYDNLNLPLPFPDALQEFRLETSSTTANMGMLGLVHPGGAVPRPGGDQQQDGDARQAVDQGGQARVGTGIDPVQVFDLQQEWTLPTAVQAQLHKGLYGAGPDHLWTGRGAERRGNSASQQEQDIGHRVLRRHADRLEILVHLGC